jgi:putative tryptophan/tyrosine transport system substrate-binding protein
MRRREFIAVASAAVAISLAAAQPSPRKPSRIGWVATSAPGVFDRAFRQALAELGYTEGKEVTIDWHWANGDFSRLPAIAANLVSERSDIIVAGGTPAALAAQKATDTIPIVMVAGIDPVQVGLVSSLARPGVNITGVSRIGPELAGKRLELLKEAFPEISGAAILWHDLRNPFTAAQLGELEAAAARLGLRLHSMELRKPEDLNAAFAAITRERGDGIVTIQDGLTLSLRMPLLGQAAAARLPAIYETRDWTEAGGLMSYGAADAELYRRAAYYVDKILKGAKPADLPVEEPAKFELVLNFKTAKALGLMIPQAILARADEVIE